MSYELHPLCTEQLTQEYLKSIIHYDAITGIFTRIKRTSSRANIGILKGYKDRHGHLRCCVKGKEYSLHRLAWLYEYGYFPNGDIDHINGVRDDNRLSNLRAISHRANIENQRMASSNNKCNTLGVSARGGSYGAKIVVNGKAIWIGSFDNPIDAHQAYLNAKRKLHSGCTI